MIKKIALICFSVLASCMAMPGYTNAQFVFPSPPPQQPEAQQQQPEAQPQQQEPAPTIPDDVRLILMIRNAVIALNQANITGNYTVLREMGTPTFQMTNNPARLAEIFANLRARKIDLSPIMVFNPKLSSAPALQDGQVLRLTGYFPTTPEQVQFDLAYQHSGDQWLLAGIAINVAPSSGAQASAAPAGQLMQATAEPEPAKPGEPKPIRIDLNQPAPQQAAPEKPKKPSAVRRHRAPKTASAHAPAAAPAPAPAAEAPAPQQTPPAKTTSGTGWNPFGQ